MENNHALIQIRNKCNDSILQKRQGNGKKARPVAKEQVVQVIQLLQGTPPKLNAADNNGNNGNANIPVPPDNDQPNMPNFRLFFILLDSFFLSLVPLVIYIAKFCTFGLVECCEEWEWNCYSNTSQIACDFWQSVGIVMDQNYFYWPTTFCVMCFLALCHKIRLLLKAGSTLIAIGNDEPSRDMKIVIYIYK